MLLVKDLEIIYIPTSGQAHGRVYLCRQNGIVIIVVFLAFFFLGALKSTQLKVYFYFNLHKAWHRKNYFITQSHCLPSSSASTSASSSSSSVSSSLLTYTLSPPLPSVLILIVLYCKIFFTINFSELLYYIHINT